MTKAAKQSSETRYRDVPKNKSEIIRVSLSEHNGHTGINIRVWYHGKESEDYLPSRKGIWIPIKAAAEVIEAVTAVLEEVEGAGE